MAHTIQSLARAQLSAKRELEVMSSTFHGEIPTAQSEYADGVSPEISWSRVEGAKSYALILEDPDAPSERPFVHWVAFNIPGDVTELEEGVKKASRPYGDAGFQQGKTSRGTVGYFGPRPPEGDGPHHYHFQVFALDTEEIDVPAGAERDQVVRAMKGHVLASGELIGTYEQPKTDQHIGAEGTEAPGESRRSGEPHSADAQEQLDAALANSFPASDPVTPKHIDDGTSPRHRSK